MDFEVNFWSLTAAHFTKLLLRSWIHSRNYTLHLDGHLVASCFKRLARRARQEIRQRPKLKDFLKAAAFRLKKAALQTARFVKSDDSLRCCCNALLMAFRNIIWTRDEVLLSCYSPETYIGPSCLGISPG